MGFLKTMFGGGKKEANEQQIKKTALGIEKPVVDLTANRGSSSKNKIKELVLLSLAEQYKVDEVKYPDFLRSTYEIGFPKEALKSLEKKGYIRPSTAAESLPYLTVAKLKEIASANNLKVSGKKDNICGLIATNIPEDTLRAYVPERYWVITEEGKKLLEENPYIAFYLDKHVYNLNMIELEIFSFSKLFENDYSGRVRDRLWGEFNRLSSEFYKKGVTTGEFQDYCELLEIMALFLKEEGKIKDALALYMRFLFYRANFQAGFKALKHYSLGYLDDDAIVLSVEVELLPYMVDQIMSMSEVCGFDSKQLRSFMLDAFSKEKDTGLFTPQELTELTMLGLNGDREGQTKICVKALKAALKKLPKKGRR